MHDDDHQDDPLPAQAGAAARFLVVRDMPMLALALGDTDADRELWRRLGDAGLAPVPRFYGVDLPRGARVGFTLSFEHLRLEDEDANGLLQLPRAAVDVDWVTTAKRLKGTMLTVALDLDLDADADDKAVCDLLDARAREGEQTGDHDAQLRAAIVGVAEPKGTLPLLF